MDAELAVDVVVPAWNSKHWLGDCLDALRSQTLPARTIIVVDDASTDGTGDWLAKHAGDLRVAHLDRNRGFAAAANRGLELSTAPLVALLNADTRADAGWLEALAGHLARAPQSVGFAASRILQLRAPDRIDSAGDQFSCYGSALKRGRGDDSKNWSRPDTVLSACAGAALYRRKMLDEIGSFDESFESYLEDVDLGMRARLAGYTCLFVPSARVLHQGGGSGLPRPRYVRLMTANRVATILRNFPGSVLRRHWLRLLWGQWYFLLAYRRPWHSALGYVSLLRRLGTILRRRRSTQASRRVSSDEFEGSLARDLGEPPLRWLLGQRLRGR
ncbi:MAG: glycosyltransferase family 2 protein [Acidobacteria bacterium]|nr:glycosyltransferase family 2 protein [Acidobacteriota bacterium]